MALEPVYSEDGVINARVKQKVGRDGDFSGFTLLEGEVAWVIKDLGKAPWNFKMGPGVYDDLDYGLDVYSKDEVYNKDEVWRKGQVYTKAQIDDLTQALKTGYRGVAYPDTNPKGNTLGYYTTSTPGTYIHFGGLVIEEGFSYIQYERNLSKWVSTTVEPVILSSADFIQDIQEEI